MVSRWSSVCLSVYPYPQMGIYCIGHILDILHSLVYSIHKNDKKMRGLVGYFFYCWVLLHFLSLEILTLSNQ